MARFRANDRGDGAKRRHRYGQAIRAQRERRGMSVADAADVFGYSTSAWSRYENGSPIPVGLPARLDEMFGTQGMFAVLWEVVKDETHPDRYQDYMREEARALEIFEYAPYRIPGLLQTSAYANAVYAAAAPEATAEEIDWKVALRLGRQDRLKGDDPPFMSVVLDEAVIRRTVGGPKVMRDQLASLLPLVDTSRSVLQIAPFTRGERGALSGPLILLTLPDLGRMAYLEGISNGQILDDPAAVRAHQRAYDRVRAEALTPGETADLIMAAIKECE
ncbi:helix-turn-helix domain-containing protein [Yinghuangia sp. ASG 101]|uniref:helix-turn-helix domain-containing protein n=1 Tax=Yinghuangia sp. ASG 101 TaxID=2896848 RepID=UPI001E607ADC|nr:helix-turn-helix transcriptional regulator [Yinghuangia sp. ASG 101]UGQ13357.1 helix-turn-helix domain-containing protein [Yinghuangia sp. ASG 101]